MELLQLEDPNKLQRYLEVLLPPILLILFMISIYLGLWAAAQINFGKLWKQIYQKFRNPLQFQLQPRIYHQTLDEEEEDDDDDKKYEGSDKQLDQTLRLDGNELRRVVKKAHDQLHPLFVIVAPGVISTCACPLVIKMGPSLVSMMWPDGFPESNINDALSVFLVPASLLYALLFTLSFQFAYEKQSVIRNLINKEVNLLYETLNLSHNFSSKDEFQSTLIRLQIAKVVHEQALDLVEQIKGLCLSSQQQQMLKMSSSLEDSSLRGGASSQQTSQTRKNRMDKIAKKGGKMETSQKNLLDKKLNKDYARKLWLLLPQIRKLVLIGGSDTINSILLSKIMDTIMDFSDAVAQRRAITQQKLNYFQWIFLEVLGFVTFIAVLLIMAGSKKFELTMCMLTAFSISLLNLVISDVDEPFHGFFKVDTNCLVQLVQQTAVEIQWMRAVVSTSAMKPVGTMTKLSPIEQKINIQQEEPEQQESSAVLY